MIYLETDRNDTDQKPPTNWCNVRYITDPHWHGTSAQTMDHTFEQREVQNHTLGRQKWDFHFQPQQNLDNKKHSQWRKTGEGIKDPTWQYGKLIARQIPVQKDTQKSDTQKSDEGHHSSTFVSWHHETAKRKQMEWTKWQKWGHKWGHGNAEYA